MKAKFYRCPICGNVIVKLVDSGVTPTCCGREMELLHENSTEGKTEYHIPVIEEEDDCTVNIRVGQEMHPHSKEHHIEFILLTTCDKDGNVGMMVKGLQAEQKPELTFHVPMKAILSIYAYCNIHGLWVKHLKECDTNSPDAKPKQDAEKCGTYPAFCGECPKDPSEAYYSCD